MRILHCADWHLRDSDIDEAEKCLNFMAAKAIKEHIDMIIVAGDVFDSRDIRMESKAARLAIKTISALANIAPVAIVLGTPSHDGSAPEILQYARGEYDIHVSSMPEQIYLDGGNLVATTDGIPEAIITLIPQPTKQFFQTASGIKQADQEIGAAMTSLSAGFGAQASNYDYDAPPHVLAYHGGISGAKISNGQTLTGMDIEVSVEQLDLTGADVHCCGHIHLGQKLRDRTFYSGSIYAKDWGENHPHGFFIHDIDGHNVTTRFIETPTRKMARASFDFTDDAKPVDWQIPGGDMSETIVRLDYTVWQDEAGAIDKEAVRKCYMDAGALDVDIRIIRKPRENVRSEAVLKVDRLRDKLAAMAELKNEPISENLLRKADSLESMTADELISMMTGKIEVAA